MKEINEKQNKRRRQRQKSKHKQKHNPHANVVKTFYETKKKTQKRKLNKNKFEIVVLKQQQQHQQQQLCTLNRRTIKDFLFKNEKKVFFCSFSCKWKSQFVEFSRASLEMEKKKEKKEAAEASQLFMQTTMQYGSCQDSPFNRKTLSTQSTCHLPLHPPAAQHPMKNTQRQPKKWKISCNVCVCHM